MDEEMAIVDELINPDLSDKPFGKRYGYGRVYEITEEVLVALHQGKLLAIDVEQEYIVFLKLAEK